MLFTISILYFVCIFCLFYVFSPFAYDTFVGVNLKRSRDLEEKMDRMFMRPQRKKIYLVYALGPFISGAIGYLFFPETIKFLGLAVGFTLGIFIPNVVIRTLEQRRQNKFNDQLVDTLMIMSSSLRGGLSLIQAIEVVVEEMPEPTNQEFGILLGENKMGVSLEDAFSHIYERMPSIFLRQVITTILLVRETGGNLPFIFARIVTTIRENKKLLSTLSNLTLQGRIQGFVMSVLPLVFAGIVLSTNPRFFDQMIKTEIGHILLTYAFFSEMIGVFIIWKISSFKDF